MEVTTEVIENITSEENNTEYSISEAIEEEDDVIIRAFLEAYTLLALVCLVTNVLTAFIIFKYRRIRQEKYNIILLNWCITNVFFMIFNPTSIRLTVDWDYLIVLNKTFCVVEQLEYTILFINIAQMVVLTAYWYTKLYASNAFTKLVNHLMFVIGCIYVFSLFLAGVYIDSCYNERAYILAEIILCLSYIAYILFTLIMNIVHAIKTRKLTDYQNKKNIPFIITNTFCLSCLPIFLSIPLGPFLEPVLHQSVVCFSLLLCIINPIYFFVILYKCDKDYNTFLKHLLSCRCTKYKEELVEQPVVYNNV